MMSPIIDANSVRKVVNVQAPQDLAWRVFTEKMGTWWPLAIYKIGKANAVDAVVEPRVGGRWYERGDDGSTCDWGSVALWETALAFGALLGDHRGLAARPKSEDGTRAALHRRRQERYARRARASPSRP